MNTKLLALALAALPVAAPAAAAPRPDAVDRRAPRPAEGTGRTEDVPVLSAEKTVLDNGLVVLVSPDHSVPGVAVDLWYRVGSRNEERGRTGFAHLFEHLMFMGATYAPYPQFDAIMEAAGGINNASTNQDVTNYFEIGPSNLLETFLWLEGDRLATLDRGMTAEKLASQRLIVQNERRQSYENRPYGMADLAVETQLWPAGHPYSWPVIGSHEDLEAATVDDVVRFFRTYYVPNNAVLSVVGDVEPARVVELARKYLGFIPRKELQAAPRPATWALPTEKRVRLTDKVESQKLLLAWPTAPAGTQGDADGDLLAAILGRGKASRLYRRLVDRDRLATEVRADQATAELQGTFVVQATAAPGHTVEELQTAIDDELARLRRDGPTDEEVRSARARLQSDVARQIQGLQARAQLLARYEVTYGDRNAIGRDLARYRGATRASLGAAARTLLVPERLAVEVRPEAGPRADGAGASNATGGPSASGASTGGAR